VSASIEQKYDDKKSTHVFHCLAHQKSGASIFSREG